VLRAAPRLVLGLVGAGGIGYEILLSMRLFEYGQVATLIAALLALVWLTDAASTALRRMLRANVPAGLLGHRRLGGGAARGAARRGDRRGSRRLVIASAAAIGLFRPRDARRRCAARPWRTWRARP